MDPSPDCAAFWSTYLRILDELIVTTPAYRAMENDVLRALAPQPGGRYLDLGCGTGSLLRGLVAAEPGAAGVGVDFSPAALEIARGKPAHGGSRLEFLEADFVHRALPFPDRAFDGVATVNTLYVLTGKGADPADRLAPLLREVRRVLGPTGRLVISAPDGWGAHLLGKVLLGSLEHYGLLLWYEGPAGLVRRTRQFWRHRAALRVISATNRALAARYVFLNRAQYRALLESNGFQVARIRRTRTGNAILVARLADSSRVRRKGCCPGG